jgi:hypothetical protein
MAVPVSRFGATLGQDRAIHLASVTVVWDEDFYGQRALSEISPHKVVLWQIKLNDRLERVSE